VIGALADITSTKPELIVLQRSEKHPKLTTSDRWLLVLLSGRLRQSKPALL
jgi:hypothetical protein